MATILTGPELPARTVARALLDIVGPERAAEVRSGTAPQRFEVPDDVAVEFERRLNAARPAAVQAIGNAQAASQAINVTVQAARDMQAASARTASVAGRTARQTGGARK